MYRQIQDEPKRQVGQRRLPKLWRVLSVIVVALGFGLLMRATLLLAAPPAAPAAANLAQSVPDHDGEGEGEGEHEDDFIFTYGIVITRPDDKVGTWVISKTSEVSFTVTEDTDTEGDLSVGACVEVKSHESDPDVALKIRPKDASHCNEEDDDDDDHEEFIITYGVIITRPEEKVGTWVISNTEEMTFTATDSTQVEGDLEVGACVAVKTLESDPTVAIKILEQDGHRCGKDDDDDDDDHKDVIIAYGIVITRPEEKVGIWVIGSLRYSATEETDLDFDHGRLAVGVCAKVVVLESDPTVAIKIESEKDYKCERDHDNNAKAVIFGVIEELPPNLHDGIWVIGGMSFTVSSSTELISKGVPFTEGHIVKVQFSTDISGTNFARRIEFKFGHNNPCRHFDIASATAAHDGGDDHRFFGYCPGREGRAVGIINDRPEGTLLGDWMIGGVPYSTTAHTVFRGDDFLEGERVKVEYVVLDDDTRLATKIVEIGSIGNPNASLFAGTVVSKPVGFVGWWNIGGGDFEAISTTIFIERGSLFAVGAYVVVDYEIVDDRRLIHKIVTYVPPGAGDENQVGVLQSIGGVAIAGTDSALQTEEVWTIDGENYIVSEATQLVDSGGELVEGATVYVNSYTDDGQRYATMIRTQGGKAFIPMAAR